ncbi:STAS-like domain-containing protein [Pediococcus pentosaceus]|uniref:STAS-like domain-containing protein n=1 Tax=Pediococcus pentosaceus TaxID=1255 RepID=UPI003F26EBEA
MKERTLNIRDEIKTPLAVTSDKAKHIFESLSFAVSNDEVIYVDFSGIETLTTAFLNIAIGQLYSISDRNILNEHIKIIGKSLTPLQRKKVQLVMDNAKTKLSKEDIEGEL